MEESLGQLFLRPATGSDGMKTKENIHMMVPCKDRRTNVLSRKVSRNTLVVYKIIKK